MALIEGTLDDRSRRRWTLAELLEESEKVARALLLRFAPGEHVAVWSANGPGWLLIEFGAALAGLTLVTVNPAYLVQELAFVLKQSRARGVLVQEGYRNRDLVAVVDSARKRCRISAIDPAVHLDGIRENRQDSDKTAVSRA